MKKPSLYILIVFALSGLQLTAQEIPFDANALEKAWESEAVFKVPESVFHDAERDVLYVSNIDGKPTDMDGNGFISKVNTQGEVIKLKWVEGLNAPKGMGTFNGKLYVTDINAVVEIDIAEGKVLNRYTVDGAKFMNDIAITDDGTLYATDMQTNKIHKLENGTIALWLENEKLKSPNGLLIHGDKLLVGCKQMLAIDLSDKSISVKVPEMQHGIDGIVKDKNGNLIFSYWQGNVFIYTPEGELTEVLSTADRKMQSADIGIIVQKNVLLVPTFFDNRIMAYTIK